MKFLNERGLYTLWAKIKSTFATAADVSSHTADKSNPHMTTASQVGAYTQSETEELIENAVSQKQDSLVSGTSIKTINGVSLLGSGDIEVQDAVDDNLSTSSENAVQNKIVTKALRDIQNLPQFSLGKTFANLSSREARVQMSDEAIDLLNKCDEITVFVNTLIGASATSHYYEAVRRVSPTFADSDLDGTTVKTCPGLYILFLSNNKVRFNVKTNSSVVFNSAPEISPLNINMFVLNRKSGVCKCYGEGGLLGTYQQDWTKFDDNWINKGEMLEFSCFSDNRTSPFLSISIFCGDMSRYYTPMAYVKKIPLFVKNLKTAEYNTDLVQRDAYNLWTDGDDGRKHRVCTAKNQNVVLEMYGYYTNTKFWNCHKVIEIHGGTFRLNGYITAVNQETGEVAGSIGDLIGKGIYDVYLYISPRNYAGDLTCYALDDDGTAEVSIISAFNFTTCAVLALFGGYDDERGFYDAASEAYLAEKYNASLEVLDYGHYDNIDDFKYVGKIKRDGNNMMIMSSDYTWKQINNV